MFTTVFAGWMSKNRTALVLVPLVAGLLCVASGQAPAQPRDVVAIAHTYEVRIRLDGRVSTVRVQANDGGHAKKLVKAQYGDKVTVLSAKRVD
jgi:hypothetical protein